MIHLTRSHNLGILSDALAEKLASKAPEDPLLTQKIMVPNLDSARWLKLFVAEKNGIAANLECLLPAEWFWKQIRKMYPDLPDLLPSDLQPMKWALYQLLLNPDNREQFPNLDGYVREQPAERMEEAVFRLAGKIASVFDEYMVYRPDMILRWQDGRSGKGDEKWQAELWGLLNRFWKQTFHNEKKKNRAELYRDVTRALSNREIETDECLYIFNPGLLPLPLIKLINEVGKQSAVFIFEIGYSAIRDNMNELYQSFGREGESIHNMINNLSINDTVDLHPEISSGNRLGRIQADIVNGKPVRTFPPEDEKLTGIEIRSCHSPLREIEVLHQFLLEKFEEDESLHPDDILIAAPDLDSYRPYIKAVFDHAENNLPQIPYHLGYSGGNTGEGIERAFLHLLSLVDSRFEFSDVMDLFMMKPVSQSFGVSESDSEKLKGWMEENNVVWGLDAKHRKEMGQPSEELQTWNSALRRGWAGHLLGGEEGAAVDDLLLYQSIRTANEQETWAAFSGYLHQLEAMRNEHKKKRSCAEWTGWLMARMQSLFDETALESGEGRELLKVLAQISEHSAAADCREEIPYSLFKNELVSMLDSHKASGALFTNGVTFSSMVPVRSIPFKVIALIGLNENEFPRKQISPDFDLMAQNPLPGERNRKNEDRNLFLESVMAAGNIHYCSYIGQSQVDNEPVPPSTIVTEWVDVLAKAPGLDAKQIIQKEALNGFSPVDFESGRSCSEIYFQTAQNLLNDEGSVSGLILDHPVPPGESEEPVELDELIRFYSNPIRWFLRKQFEVKLRETDREKDEFVLDHLQYHILFQRVFGWMLSGTTSEQVKKYLARSGAVPAGWPGERKINTVRENVHMAISALREAQISPEQVHREFSFRLDEHSAIEGTLTSYSAKQFVDINPAKLSGKIIFSSWIKHLCGQITHQFEEKRSILFCDLKKGAPEKRILLPVQHPEAVMAGLIDFYRQGLTEPQTFFPKSLYAFEEAERDEKKSGSFKRAASEFEGGFKSHGEKEDLSILTVMGDDVAFQTEFIAERYRQMISQMMDHMEEV